MHRAANCVATHVVDLAPPAWAQELVGAAVDSKLALSRVDSKHFALISVRIRGASGLDPQAMEEQSFQAYIALAAELAKTPRRHAVRFWNHVPFINEPADAGRDNYMVFNAGRFRAFSDLYRGPAYFDRDLATASATGHCGDELVIHCLAADAPGQAINNPRQVAPYHYSQRFGPLPPCFARAMRLAMPPGWLMVGGTASIRGEDSIHMHDLPAQCSETFTNVAALLATSMGQKLSTKPKLSEWLNAFLELRVYYPDVSDADAIEAAIHEAFPTLRRLELLPANLCRADLLVEVEGLVDLNLLNSR